VAAGHSTEPPPRAAGTPGERLAAIGAIVVIASPLLPWYGVPVGGGLSKTGFEGFGLAHLAMLITAAAALVLIGRHARGYLPPRPLGVGGLLIIAGTWIAVLICYLIAVRPEELAGSFNVNLRLGPFVALGGAVTIVIGGIRVRALTIPPPPAPK
jgi:hypothetical protein